MRHKTSIGFRIAPLFAALFLICLGFAASSDIVFQGYISGAPRWFVVLSNAAEAGMIPLSILLSLSVLWGFFAARNSN
jgi:hypothetical protein